MESRAQKLWDRGIGHFRLGNLEAAQASFEAFLLREPGQAGPARFRLSMIQARRGRFRAAVELGKLALAGEPDQVELLTHLARCQLMDGEPEQARRLAMRALASAGKGPVVLDSLAVVMTRLDEPVLALELFNQAIVLEPNQGSMYFNRALAHKQFGMLEAARRDLESCIALRPSHAKAHWNLAEFMPAGGAQEHTESLSRLLAQPGLPASDEELLSLAQFKELDEAGNVPRARIALARGVASRRRSGRASPGGMAATVDALILSCNRAFPRRSTLGSLEAAPLFIFGMPRSGTALLGKLLSRHPKVHHLGSQQPFSRLLWRRLGRDPMAFPDAATVQQLASMDFSLIGREYLGAVSPPSGASLLICESQPMNFLMAGFIARALPGARLLHLVRDPVDNCVAILGHPGGEASLPSHDPGALAESYLQYLRLIRHWHEMLSERIMDVSYESLVQRPEMVLRVVCSFLGLRYGSALRAGLQLHGRGIGRGRRYAGEFPALLATLSAAEPHLPL